MHAFVFFRLKPLVFMLTFLSSAGCKETSEKTKDAKKTESSKPSKASNKTGLSLHEPSPPPQKGIALGLYSEDPDWSYEPLLGEIAAIGASHVSLVVNFHLETIYSTEILSHPRYTPPDRVLIRVIRNAKQAGLEVFLFPILRVLDRPTPQHWRGNLKPIDPEELQKNYTSLMVRLASIAEKEGVHSLSIGSELSSLDTDVEWFRPIVAAVREKFSGSIVYSGNWDHYYNVKIWPLVDALGVSGYFELLSDDESPTLAALTSAWKKHRITIEKWVDKQDRPLVFTEIGYMSRKGSARRPWDEGSREPVDLEEQRKAYEAFVRTWNGSPLLEGVYFWNWYGWGGSDDPSYTPRGKPAAEIISWWYGGTRPMKWWVPR